MREVFAVRRKRDPLTLPEGYTLLREINIQKDKKLSLWLNVASTLLFLLMFFLPLPHKKVTIEFGLHSLLDMLALLAGLAVYMIAHELIHGMMMKYYCGQKAHYGFAGLFAYAGQKDAHFSKRHYCVIGLAPIVLLGLLLLLLMVLCPPPCYWPLFIIQAMNISGSVGDLYVAWLLLRMPADTLCNDDGLSMRFYARG